MNLSSPFVRRPIGTILLTIGVALAGVGAFFNLPVSPLPQVDFPTISVQAQLPGASPETMASSVATPLERRLGIIADVTEMTSSSRTGSTNVTLQFGLDRDIDGAARDVQAAINAARVDLPATLKSNPTYRKLNPADQPIMVLALTSQTRTPGQIYDAAANIVQQQLSQVKGVGDVEVGGASLPAVRVELNPLALARYGIGLEDVRAALASANANRPKGVIDDGKLRLQIYTNDAGTKAADYAPLLVAYRSGSAVRLSDIADVEDGVEDIHNLGLYLQKKPRAGPVKEPPPGQMYGQRGGGGPGGAGAGGGAGFGPAASPGGGPGEGQTSAQSNAAVPTNSASDQTNSAAAQSNGAAANAGGAPGGGQFAGFGSGAGGGRRYGGGGYSANFGQPAVIVQVFRQPAANIISTVDAVKARIPAVEAALPQDIDMQVAVDRTTTIRASLTEVELTVLFSVVLVIGVVAFFLMNGRAVLIPSVAVAVSLLGALGAMFLLGFSLDNLSLMALTISTGFVVDDAIVVLENVTRHVEAGMDRFEAALKGAQEVGFTVLSISISLIAVFLPILLMGGIVGRLFREFAMTLSVAIIVSLIISLTTTPMLAAYLVGRPKPYAEKGWLGRLSDNTVHGMRDIYEKGLDWALDAGPIVLTILIATIVLNFYLFAVVPKGFFPEQDTGMLAGGLQSDQSSSFQVTENRLRRFVAIIGADRDVQTVVAFVGGGGRGGASAFLLVSLFPENQRAASADAVVARLRPFLGRISGASLFLNPVQDLRIGGRQSNATYQYTLEADSLADLRTWAVKLTEAMTNEPALEDVNSDQQDHGLQSFITIDHDKASRLGLTNSAIDNVLYDAFGQRNASVIYQDVNQYYVVMEVAPQYQQDPTTLQDVYISTQSVATAAPGQTAALGATPIGISSQAVNVNQSTQAAIAASGLPPAVPASNVTPSTKAASVATGLPSTTTSTQTGGASSAGAALEAASTASVSTSGGAGPTVLTGPVGAAATGATAVSGPAAPPTRAASTGVALSSQAETEVPLSAIATWADGSAPTSVNHQGTEPATTISYNLAPGKSLSDATAAIDDAQASIGMPKTVQGSSAGTAQTFQSSLSSEPILIIAALVAIYLVLGILYESYIHPLTVLSTLPSAGVGAVIALIIFHIEFSIIALIGVILLIGIVKKNAILMIDFALNAEREEGLSSREAIRQAALTRFRPIMMTTFAAILGALPLAIGWGDGAELRRPLGITIIGGLMVSQVITLITTPVVYLYLDRFRRTRPAPQPIEGPAPLPVPAA